jgi:hypothetical protein
MTTLQFSYQGHKYRAEVLVDHDLELDEILSLQELTASGTFRRVVDTAELEPAVEGALELRAEELREHRDKLRRQRPARIPQPHDVPAHDVPAHDAPASTARVTPLQKKSPILQETSCVVPAPVLQCELSSGVGNDATPSSTRLAEVSIMATFTRTHVNKAGATSFKQSGSNARILFPKALFPNGAPETIEIEAVGLFAPAPKVKLTPEERKALKAAETPEMKAEKLRKQIAAAQERMAKLQAEMSL